ncbi:MAG: helix-turn-helix transcriptional regulator [Akkermansiaceae bacterium]|nr:helix-turn-helix transcriptional regulator [Akkermansiaceae bacterium]
MEQSSSPKNLTGASVQRIRSAAGLSQEGLAAKLQLAGWDLSRAGLAKIEARIRKVSDAELLLLARVLEKEVSEFFQESDDPFLVIGERGG